MSAPPMSGPVAGWAATAAELITVQAELAAARVDQLTGVLTRGAWMAVAHQWFDRPAGPLLLITVDLDGLKPVNDRYGHPAGDLLLHETGARLRSFVQPRHGLAGRLGGDEFALLLVGGTAADVANLETVLDEPVRRLGAPALPAGASLGAVSCTEAPTCTVDGAMAHADRAMYAHKRARAGRRAS